jgi:hypothetical protein
MGSINCIPMEPDLFIVNGNKEVIAFPNGKIKNSIHRINKKFVVVLKANDWDSLVIKSLSADSMLDMYEQ